MHKDFMHYQEASACLFTYYNHFKNLYKEGLTLEIYFTVFCLFFALCMIYFWQIIVSVGSKRIDESCWENYKTLLQASFSRHNGTRYHPPLLVLRQRALLPNQIKLACHIFLPPDVSAVSTCPPSPLQRRRSAVRVTPGLKKYLACAAYNTSKNSPFRARPQLTTLVFTVRRVAVFI
jgi:hypothetical protein